MKYGLKQEVIHQLQSLFVQYPELEKVIIYGSRSQGTYRKGSDIDLSFFGVNLNQAQLFTLDFQIDELNLPYMFDLSLFEQIENPELQQKILSTGQIFYQK